VERICPGDVVALAADVVPVPMNARGVLILAGGGDAVTAGSARPADREHPVSSGPGNAWAVGMVSRLSLEVLEGPGSATGVQAALKLTVQRSRVGEAGVHGTQGMSERVQLFDDVGIGDQGDAEHSGVGQRVEGDADVAWVHRSGHHG
jgi:hypothetical protein